MKTKSYGILLAMVLALAVTIAAQVPSMLNYQGRIAVNGVNFSGTGQFKFALINTNGSQSFWSNDGTSSAGSQPAAAVSIPVNSGIYNVRLGDTTLPNMTAVPATVFGNPDVHLRVWFNDGANGWQQMSPDQRIAAVGYAMMANTVQDGAITSAKIANGAVGASQLAPGAVSSGLQNAGLSAVGAGGIIGSNDPNSAALLAAGFVRDPTVMTSDDTWQMLPSGDAVAAHTAVWTGTELLIWGGVVPNPDSTGGPNSVFAINRGVRFNPSTGVWSPISLSGAPQARWGHSAVWTGTEMIIWGGQTADTSGSPATVLNTGGRYNPATNTWSSMSAAFAPGPLPAPAYALQGHMAFWTGTEMLIWGGSISTSTFGMSGGGGSPMQGKRYNASTDTWSDLPMNPPEVSGGMNWKGIWTGLEMIVWSWQNPGVPDPPNAGRYNPTSNTWQTLPRIPGDPQLPDSGFSWVWSGTEAILWGGGSAGIPLAHSGHKFNPATSAWSPVSTSGAPETRTGHSAAFVGSEMVVWGGAGEMLPPAVSAPQYLNGGRYNPTSNTWTALPAAGSPANRQSHSVTVAGSQMLVWGGIGYNPMGTSPYKFLKNGGSLDLGTGAWTPLSNGSPAPRSGHSLIWTGTEMIVWGGTSGTNSISGDPAFADGARFGPATGNWIPLPSANAPSARWGHSTIWTGTEMIVWGGQNVSSAGGPTGEVYNTGARYNPATNTWSPTSLLYAPLARSAHSAVWTGTEMIIWGGTTDGSTIATDTGARYNPATDTWTAISQTGSPSSRKDHKAVWTGSEMIIWNLNAMSNGRYRPATNTWASVSSITFPQPGLETYSAVWTGSEMIVIGTGFSAPAYSYSPVSDLWLNIADPYVGTSTISGGHAVWTGSEVIFWALSSVPAPNVPLAFINRYSPALGVWERGISDGSLLRRTGGAVWTGSEMLMWGGGLGSMPAESTLHDLGSRYALPKNYYLYKRP